jgi:hypothetical protein
VSVYNCLSNDARTASCLDTAIQLYNSFCLYTRNLLRTAHRAKLLASCWHLVVCAIRRELVIGTRHHPEYPFRSLGRYLVASGAYNLDALARLIWSGVPHAIASRSLSEDEEKFSIMFRSASGCLPFLNRRPTTYLTLTLSACVCEKKNVRP